MYNIYIYYIYMYIFSLISDGDALQTIQKLVGNTDGVNCLEVWELLGAALIKGWR